MDNIDVIIRRSDNIIFRKIEGETILLPMASSSEKVEYIYNFNEIGAVIWEKIDGGKTVRDIINELIEEFEADSITIEKQVVEFISELSDSKLIDIV
jgi:hypothetical protein